MSLSPRSKRLNISRCSVMDQNRMKTNGNVGFFHHAISRNERNGTTAWNEYREKLRHLKHSPFVGFFTFLEANREYDYRSMRKKRSRKREHFSSLNWFVAAYEQGFYTTVSESNIPGDSNVVLVMSPRTRKMFALKVIRKRRFQREQELEIHSRMDHPNILKLLDAYETFDRSYLLFEKQKSDLKDLMFNKRRFNEIETAKITTQLLSALKCVHVKHNLVHGDIKPDNVLIGFDMKVYLSDFGNAFTRGQEIENSTNQNKENGFFMCQGSYEYAAPEVMLDIPGSRRDFPIDMWSIGVIAFELLAGFEPFYPPSAAMKEDLVLSARYWSEISSHCQHFVKSLLSRCPDDRMRVDEALECTWLREEEERFYSSSSMMM